MATTSYIQVPRLLIFLVVSILAMPLEAHAQLVQSFTKVSSAQGMEGKLDDRDYFGRSVANVGDLNGDGVDELAVGAILDDDGGDDGISNHGAVWILFMDPEGRVAHVQKISDTEGGFEGVLEDSNQFGSAVAGLGDFDGDGIPDMAVAAPFDNDGGISSGAVYVLFLRADGTVKNHQKIGNTSGGLEGKLGPSTSFGVSLATIGDLDGDGIQDLAVGSSRGAAWEKAYGVLWILFLKSDGTVRTYQKISQFEGGFDPDQSLLPFGISVASIDDINGDGTPDLAVGALGRYVAGTGFGSVWILQMNPDGTVKQQRGIYRNDFDDDTDKVELLNENFGVSVARIGDINGDGIIDIAIGADGGFFRNGMVFLLTLKSDGSIRDYYVISEGVNGFTGDLEKEDLFGQSITLLNASNAGGDFRLAIGAGLDDDGGSNRGSLWILKLNVLPASTNSILSHVSGSWEASADVATQQSPDGTMRAWNHPNPFNPSTTLRIELTDAAEIRLSVYDMLGREVARLLDGGLEAGSHEVVFDAGGLPSGTYLYRLETPTGNLTRTMLLLK